MENGNSSMGGEARGHGAVARRQSYVLLVFGIAVALVLPHLLQPRPATPGAAPATATRSARPLGGSTSP